MENFLLWSDSQQPEFKSLTASPPAIESGVKSQTPGGKVKSKATELLAKPERCYTGVEATALVLVFAAHK